MFSNFCQSCCSPPLLTLVFGTKILELPQLNIINYTFFIGRFSNKFYDKKVAIKEENDSLARTL